MRLFVRREPYGRYLSCLVYLPRDRYTTSVRNRMQEILMRQLGGASIDYTARVSESVLARLFFVLRMPVGESMGEIDVRALEREAAATRSGTTSSPRSSPAWSIPETLATLAAPCREGYKRNTPPGRACSTCMAYGLRDESDMSMAMYRPDRPDDEADLRLKIFRGAEPLSLSKIMPHLSLLGVDVVDERPYELQLGGRRGLHLRLRRDGARRQRGGGEPLADRCRESASSRPSPPATGARSEPTPSTPW